MPDDRYKAYRKYFFHKKAGFAESEAGLYISETSCRLSVKPELDILGKWHKEARAKGIRFTCLIPVRLTAVEEMVELTNGAHISREEYEYQISISYSVIGNLRDSFYVYKEDGMAGYMYDATSASVTGASLLKSLNKQIMPVAKSSYYSILKSVNNISVDTSRADASHPFYGNRYITIKHSESIRAKIVEASNTIEAMICMEEVHV